MAFNFADTRVNTTSPVRKVPEVVAVKLGASDFTTGGTASVKAVLPKDASIIGFRLWNKTVLSGNSISAATLSIGVTGTATKYVNAVSAFGSTNAYSVIAAASNIFQTEGAETGDISLLFTGTATTGNPTAGELYVLVEYVR
jgi:hypothetical protein